MNILVIGNGFDLAHDLPTKYTDFLLFCNIVLNIIEESHVGHLIPRSDKEYEKWIEKTDKIPLVDGDTINKIGIALRSSVITDRDKEICMNMIYDFFLFNFSEDKNNPQLVKELFYLIYNNNWIEYFLQCDMHGKENWIDFESEMSDVIESIDIGMDNSLLPQKLLSAINRLENDFFNNRFTNYVPEYIQATAEEQEKIEKQKISYKELRDILLADLNKLIRVFEIYLAEYVEKISIKEKSPDIENIIVQMNQNEGENYILNFNYTHIIQKVYLSRYKDGLIKDMDYIHGEANINNAIESDNIVLGIGEYLPDDKKNRKIDFITFKKFYQRMHKQTGCMYKEWIDNIKWDFRRFVRKQEELEKRKYIYTDDPLRRFINHNVISLEDEDCPKHDIYIFGHSLAETDSDIFRDLILNDNVHTTIFYHDKDAMGQQIANLVKVIGQDELIRRTGGSTKTIEFKQQQNMVPIKEQGING